jgi:transposase
VAVALNVNGGVIDSRSFTADTGGYIQLIDWAVGLDSASMTFAVEGTGSYGGGLTSAVRRAGIGAVDVMRTDRRPGCSSRLGRMRGC